MPNSRRPHLRLPVRRMKASVSSPPTRQASDPSNSGMPAIRLNVQKPWVSLVTFSLRCPPPAVRRYLGSQVMLKYHP